VKSRRTSQVRAIIAKTSPLRKPPPEAVARDGCCPELAEGQRPAVGRPIMAAVAGRPVAST